MPVAYNHRGSFSASSRQQSFQASNKPLQSVLADQPQFPEHAGQDLIPAFSQMTVRAPHLNGRQSSRTSHMPGLGGHAHYTLPSNQNVYQVNTNDRFQDVQDDFSQDSMGISDSYLGNAMHAGTNYNQDAIIERQLSSPGMLSSGLAPLRDSSAYYYSDFNSSRATNARQSGGLQISAPDISSSSILAQQSRAPYTHQYDLPSQQVLANQSLKYYNTGQPVYGAYSAAPALSRYPNLDPDPNQVNRSPLLKEFRATFKTRQWELKV